MLFRTSIAQVLVAICLMVAIGSQVAKAQGPSQKEFVRVYGAVIDPKNVRDIFGKRIAERFIVIQVTITNRNADFQYLIQDVSLDLTKVFVNERKALALTRVEAPSRLLNPGDITDLTGLLLRLREAGGKSARTPSKRLMELLPADLQKDIKAAKTADDLKRIDRSRVITALNDVVRRRDFYQEKDFASVQLGSNQTPLLSADKETLSYADVETLNRALINSAFADFISESQPSQPDAKRSEYEMSSLELSLIRGVAEKGQGGDPRNRLLRYLRGVGTIAAGLIGVASFGPSYAESVAIFNGPFNSAYVEAFPDYTINQMNRLNDSAYKSNTLVPKQQSRVLVAFIPQAIFMTNYQRKLFWKDPTLLYRNQSKERIEANKGRENLAQYDIDFRKVVVRVDGSFITEVENLPPVATTVVIEPEEMQKFEQNNPVVKGYISGRGLQKARVDLLNEAPEGLTIKMDGDPTENRIRFTITSDKPVPPNTRLDFEISTDQSTQTISKFIRYMADKPAIDSTDPTPLEGQQGKQDLQVSFTGSNLISGTTRVLTENNKGVHVVPNSTKVEGNKLTVVLKIDANAPPGESNVTLINGASQSDPVTINVTAAPTNP
jgi:hypothetical protein